MADADGGDGNNDLVKRMEARKLARSGGKGVAGSDAEDVKKAREDAVKALREKRAQEQLAKRQELENRMKATSNNAEVEQIQQEMEGMKAKLESLKGELEDAHRERDEIRETANTKREELEKQLDSLKTSLESQLSSTKDTLSGRVKELEAELAKVKAEAATAQTTLTTVRSACESAEAERDSLRNEVTDLTVRVANELANTNSTAEEKQSELKKTMDGLRERLEASQTSLHETTRERDELRKQVEGVVSRKGELEHQMDELRTTIAAHEEAISKQNAIMSTHKQLVEAKDAEHDRALKEIQRLNVTIARSKSVQLQGQMEEAERAREVALREIAQLQKELRTVIAERDETRRVNVALSNLGPVASGPLPLGGLGGAKVPHTFGRNDARDVQDLLLSGEGRPDVRNAGLLAAMEKSDKLVRDKVASAVELMTGVMIATTIPPAPPAAPPSQPPSLAANGVMLPGGEATGSPSHPLRESLISLQQRVFALDNENKTLHAALQASRNDAAAAHAASAEAVRSTKASLDADRSALRAERDAELMRLRVAVESASARQQELMADLQRGFVAELQQMDSDHKRTLAEADAQARDLVAKAEAAAAAARAEADSARCAICSGHTQPHGWNGDGWDGECGYDDDAPPRDSFEWPGSVSACGERPRRAFDANSWFEADARAAVGGNGNVNIPVRMCGRGTGTVRARGGAAPASTVAEGVSGALTRATQRRLQAQLRPAVPLCVVCGSSTGGDARKLDVVESTVEALDAAERGPPCLRLMVYERPLHLALQEVSNEVDRGGGHRTKPKPKGALTVESMHGFGVQIAVRKDRLAVVAKGAHGEFAVQAGGVPSQGGTAAVLGGGHGRSGIPSPQSSSDNEGGDTMVIGSRSARRVYGPATAFKVSGVAAAMARLAAAVQPEKGGDVYDRISATKRHAAIWQPPAGAGMRSPRGVRMDTASDLLRTRTSEHTVLTPGLLSSGGGLDGASALLMMSEDGNYYDSVVGMLMHEQENDVNVGSGRAGRLREPLRQNLAAADDTRTSARSRSRREKSRTRTTIGTHASIGATMTSMRTDSSLHIPPSARGGPFNGLAGGTALSQKDPLGPLAAVVRGRTADAERRTAVWRFTSESGAVVTVTVGVEVP